MNIVAILRFELASVMRSRKSGCAVVDQSQVLSQSAISRADPQMCLGLGRVRCVLVVLNFCTVTCEFGGQVGNVFILTSLDLFVE